jgi:polysaccharide export outer membrane protein
MLRRWLLLEKKGALMRTRWTAPVTLLAFLVVSNVWVKAQQSGAPVVADEYVLGVEDKLGISVWREAELGKSVVIRPDGKVTFPLVGDVQAAGRTPRQLTEDLTKSIAKYIKEPVVTVVVEEINNFKVFVLGEVTVQGTLNLRRHTRLLEAIAMAGGVTQFADRSNVVLLRYQDGKEARTKIDYRKIVSGDKPELNVELKPGDTIIVN